MSDGSRERLKQAIYAFIRTDKMHRAQFDRMVRQSEIHRNQHMLLMEISRNELTSSQKQLAEKFEVSPAAIATALNRLERDGFIQRTVSDQDNRYKEIRITEKGSRIVEQTRRAFYAVDEQMFSGFSDEELEALMSYHQRLQENLKNLDVASLPGIADQKEELK